MSLLVARRGSIHRPKTGGGGGTFDPLSISWHTAFWAEDPDWTDPGDGNAVSQWDDASGNGRHATQGTASVQPTYRASTAAFNSNPTVEFDGDDDLSTATFADITGECEYFIVGSRSDDDNTEFFVDGVTSGKRRGVFQIVGGGGTNWWAIYAGFTREGGSTPDTAPHALRAVFDGDDTLHYDGTEIINDNAGSDDLDGLYLGRGQGGGGRLVGHIAFVGLKEGTLTSQERADLLSWAQSHYGTP